MKTKYDWKAVQDYYDHRHERLECQGRFGFSAGAWYNATKLGRIVLHRFRFRDGRRRYDWHSVQTYYDEGRSMRECMARLDQGRRRSPSISSLPRVRRAVPSNAGCSPRNPTQRMLALRPIGVARKPSFGSNRSYQRNARRSPGRKPTHALSELPQPDADFWRQKCKSA